MNCQEFYSFCKTPIKLAVAGNGGLTVKLDRGLVGQAGAVLPHPTMIQECGIKKRPAPAMAVVWGHQPVRASPKYAAGHPTTSHENSADVITCVSHN